MTKQPTQPHLTVIGTPSNLQEATKQWGAFRLGHN